MANESLNGGIAGRSAGPENAAMRPVSMPSISCAIAAIVLPLVALADPGYYVVTPYDRAGLATLELRYWTFRLPHRTEVVWPEWALGYGVNARWTTTLLVSYEGTLNGAIDTSSVNWQNVVMLTQGEWPLDVALYGAWIHSRNDEFSHTVEWGPMLQTDIGRTHLNLNLVFERVSGTGRPAPTQLKYQWQIKHHWQPGWQLGLQGFGELGPWDQWAASAVQSHRAGPAVFAQWPGDGKQLLEVQLAVLWGHTFTLTGRMISARAAYSF